jgi:hypothetical protein
MKIVIALMALSLIAVLAARAQSQRYKARLSGMTRASWLATYFRATPA